MRPRHLNLILILEISCRDPDLLRKVKYLLLKIGITNTLTEVGGPFPVPLTLDCKI